MPGLTVFPCMCYVHHLLFVYYKASAWPDDVPVVMARRRMSAIAPQGKGRHMYAVVTTGNRQYRVSPGDTIRVEKLTGVVGDTVSLTHVQLLEQDAEVTIGTPVVAGARVEAQIVAQNRGKKIIIFKHRRRKGYRRKQGHRQSLTSLKITGIYTTAQSELTEAQSELTEHSEPTEHSDPAPVMQEGIA